MARAPSLSTIVKRALDGEAALPRSSVVVVAVSGGPDSMAMLEVLARVGPKARLSIVAHGVDHGLRKEAAAELDLAEAFADRLGVPFDRTRVDVPRGGNLQARARVLRWRALVAVARRHRAAIATAHHADDRAETLLIRLLRGSGLRGLGILTPRATAHGTKDVAVIRPLLRARRADVLAHLVHHRIPHAQDPSNVDPRYLRTRVRERVLPLLADLDANIVRHLEAVADEAAAMAEPLLSSSSAVPLQSLPGSAPPGWAAQLPRATQVALASMTSTRSPDARVWLPGGLVVSVDPRAREGTSGRKARSR